MTAVDKPGLVMLLEKGSGREGGVGAGRTEDWRRQIVEKYKGGARPWLGE